MLFVSVSAASQNGTVALGNVHMRPDPSLRSFLKDVLETIPMLISMETGCSQPLGLGKREGGGGGVGGG